MTRNLESTPSNTVQIVAGSASMGSVTIGAGSALVGKVGIDQTTPGTTDRTTSGGAKASVAVEFTRPADTTAYAALDVIGVNLTVTGATNATPIVITCGTH